MFTSDQKNEIMGIIQTQLSNFNSPPVATHFHNGWDANQLDPAIALLGFPVVQVADASMAPTYQSTNGKFIFQVDFKTGTPHYYLWSFLTYVNTTTNVSVSAWKGTSIGSSSNPYLKGSLVYAGSTLNPGDSFGLIVPVTGAVFGNFAIGAYSTTISGVFMSAKVYSADNVEVQFANLGGAILTIPSGTVSALIIIYP
jgi:hypothetical protein